MSEPEAHEVTDLTALNRLKERLANFAGDDADGYGDLYGLELSRAERNVLRAVLAENARLRNELERLGKQTERQVRERVAAELARIPIVQHLGIGGCDSFLRQVAESTMRYASMVAVEGVGTSGNDDD